MAIGCESTHGALRPQRPATIFSPRRRSLLRLADRLPGNRPVSAAVWEVSDRGSGGGDQVGVLWRRELCGRAGMFDEFGLEPQAVSAGTGRASRAWGRESHRGIAHCALRKDRDVFRWQRLVAFCRSLSVLQPVLIEVQAVDH